MIANDQGQTDDNDRIAKYISDQIYRYTTAQFSYLLASGNHVSSSDTRDKFNVKRIAGLPPRSTNFGFMLIVLALYIVRF